MSKRGPGPAADVDMPPAPQGPRVRTVLLSLLGLLIVAGLVWYLVANAEKYVGLLRVSVGGVIGIFVLTVLFSVLNAVINTYIFRAVGADMGHGESFLLTATATLANQLPLPVGMLTRAVYLKRRYGLSYMRYISSQVAVMVGVIAVDGMLGLAILLGWVLFGNASVSPGLFLAFGIMAAAILTFWLPLKRLRLPVFMRGPVQQALDGWGYIGGNTPLLMRLLVLKISATVIVALRYWLAFDMLSQRLTAGQVLLFAAATVLTQLVSFAPGNLGVREAIVGAVAAALRLDFAVGVAAVGLDRIVATTAYVILGWVSALLLGRRLSGAGAAPDQPGP